MSENLSVEEYLLSKGASLRKTGNGQLLMHCLWHDDSKHRNGKLYVNAEHGAFHCKSCDHSGGLRALMEHFGDAPEKRMSANVLKSANRSEILTDYVDYCAEQLLKNHDMYNYLLNRGIMPDVVERYKIGYHAADDNILPLLEKYSPQEVIDSGIRGKSGWQLAGHITVPYMSNGKVLAVRGKDPAGKYKTLFGDPVRLFNADSLRGANTVFITEGEFDALVVQDLFESSPDIAMRNIAVVGLPGVQVWPGSNDGFKALLEPFRRVYVGFDTDNAGRNGAVKLRELVGGQAKVVEIPEEGMDWTDWLIDKRTGNFVHTWKEVAALIQEAEDRDKRVFSVEDSIKAYEEEESAGIGLMTGFASLDALLPRGLRPGNLLVPIAGTGVGKSVFLQNIFWNMRARRCLLVTPELTRAEVWSRMRKIARFHIPWIDDDRVLARELSNLMIVEENAVRPADLRKYVEEYASAHGDMPEVIGMDYLGYMARHAPGKDEYERNTNAVMDLKALGKELGIPIIAPHQVNRTGGAGEAPDASKARGAGTIEETADIMLGLWTPWQKDSQGEVGDEFMVKILKSRQGNRDRVASLAISGMSLAIVDGNDRARRMKITSENEAVNRKESWDSHWKRTHQQALAVKAAENTLVPF